MITINGAKFAENEREFMEALFVPGGTCAGYAKKKKGSKSIYHLSTPQGHLFAAIGYNAHGPLMVSASIQDGKPWYMYSLTRDARLLLNTEGMGYLAEMEMVRDTVRELFPGFDLIHI